MKLKKSLTAWQTDKFNGVLKSELCATDTRLLPLQAGLSQGGHVADTEGFSVMLLNSSDSATDIEVRVGIFFSSIISGCACDDDPTPLDTLNEYCELHISIDKITAETRISLINN